jgi:hypothetical protein
MELPAKQPKPLTIGRLALGVCLGILLASGVAGFAYYLSVERPHQAAALRQAQINADQSLDGLASETRRIEEHNAELERQLRALQPGSPCNVLGGTLLAQCSNLPNNQAKRKFVAQNSTKPKS